MAKFFSNFRISENLRATPEGFLICLGVPIARTGEMEYRKGESPIDVGPDGIARVSREAAEVFRPETIASFEGKPVTIGHPEPFVGPDNWSQLAKGVVQNVRRGSGEFENDLLADLLLTDSATIELVRNGLREVSCGYEADYVQTGEGRGSQVKILGNHVALVREGRAGASYAIRDGKGNSMSVKDRIRAMFAKAQNDALALVEEAEAATPPVTAKTADKKAADAAPDMAPFLDAMGKCTDAMNALTEKLSGGSTAKDATIPPTQSTPAVVEAKDDASIESRVARLEANIAKIMKAVGAEEDVAVVADEDGDDEEEIEVTDEDEGELVGDNAGGEAGEEGSRKKTGDAKAADPDEDDEDEDLAARVEILAPGMKAAGKNVKTRALVAAFQTADGKPVLTALGFNPKKPETHDVVFRAASELLKSKRTSDFSKTKGKVITLDHTGVHRMGVSADQLNKIHEAHYLGKK